MCNTSVTAYFIKFEGCIMSAKEFLNKIRAIDTMVDCKLEQVARLRALLTGGAIRYDKEKVQSSIHEDTMTNTVAKIIELDEQINNDIDLLVEYKSRARELIEQLPNDIEKIILYKRYFDNKTFEQISVECNYGWRHTCRLHGKALNSLNKVMQSKF